jgi:hypothetical protein
VYLLRCTARLRRDAERQLAPARTRDRSDTALGDWFANRLNVGPQRYIVATNGATLLTIVVPARDLGSLHGRMADTLDRLLEHLGAGAAARRAEVAAMREVRVARTDSRRVLGSMTHLAGLAWEELCELPHRPGRTLHHVNARLAAESLAALGYAAPGDRALRVLAARTARVSAVRQRVLR